MKLFSLIVIAVTIFFPIIAHAEMSIESDKKNYGVIDLIRITGYIENFETYYDRYQISDPITITFYQNDESVFSDSFTYWKTQSDTRYVIDGHFSAFFLPKYQIPMDWSGEYKVTATYQDQSASTTFAFVGTDTFEGLTSVSKDGTLQIDQSEYFINSKSEFIEVKGICGACGSNRSIVFELSNEHSVINSQEFDYVSPTIKVPNEISDQLSDRVGATVTPISTKFELTSDLPSGKYFVEMYRPDIPLTPDEISDCKYLRICTSKNHYEHIPKIEFSVTHLSEIPHQRLLNEQKQTMIEITEPTTENRKIPEWIKNNAAWWAEGNIEDGTFVSGIQYLMKEKIVNIPDLPKQASEKARPSFVDETKDPQHYIDRYNNEPDYKDWFDSNYPDYTIEEAVGIPAPIPGWIKKTAGWWSDGLITEDDFIKGIEFLAKSGIIRVD